MRANSLSIALGKKRSKRGNITALSTLIGGMVVFVILIGMSFYLILSHQQRGQAACDQISVTLAKALNAGDRIGQMNATVEHSRELVHLSRENLITAGNLGVRGYQLMAEQLLLEARDSAGIVDKERENQIKLAISEARTAIKKSEPAVREKKGIFILPWFLETTPVIDQVRFGWIKDTLSSAECPQVLSALQRYDIKKGQVEPISKLFYGNVNAKLPPPDDDLPFHFASLPAEVRHMNAPPRLVNPDAFISTATVFDKDVSDLFQRPVELPSAVQVYGVIGIKTSKQTEFELKIISSATASSALQAP